MGLDIIIHKRAQRNILEIREPLHKDIISVYNNYKGEQDTPFIEQIKDYYKTDLFLQGDSIEGLIADLSFVLSKINSYRASELSNIIKELAQPDIEKIHISGD